MNRAILALALVLPACSPTLSLNAALTAEQSATCPESRRDYEALAQLYSARALFDRTARDGLSDEQRAELDAAREAMDARCGLG